MATTILSGIGVSALSGSIGDTTFTFNRFGQYAKARGPLPAGSSYLSDWQAVVGNLTDIWEIMMDDTDRAAWYQYAVLSKNNLGEKFNIDGFYSYMQVNLNLTLIEQPNIIVPPVYEYPPLITGLSFAPLSGPETMFLNFTTVAECHVAIYCTRPLPPGRMSNNQIYKYMKHDATGVGSWNAECGSQWETRFGLMSSFIGMKIFMKVVVIHKLTGVRTPGIYASAIIT